MWKTKNTKILLEDYFLTVRKDRVELPDGAVIDDFYTVTIPDTAIVCALTAEGNVLLKSEYRYACGAEVVECPGGMFEKDETDPLAVAKRELLEETGYESDDWTYLGQTLDSTSKLSGRVHLFLAKNCVKTGQQHLDANEHLTVTEICLERAVDMVMNGTICANSTAHLLLKTARLRNK